MADNKTILEEINKYCSPNSLLILDKHGVLRRLLCPFRVKVKPDTLIFPNKDICLVEAVKINDDLLLLYVIMHKAYPYYYFIIIL